MIRVYYRYGYGGGSTQTTANNNTSTEIGTGLANSNAIIAQTGHTESAAKVCRDYNGGGKTDWFLPSKDELAALYLQKDIVGGFSPNDNSYWSSSEYTSPRALYQTFTTGSQGAIDKNNTSRVRAVRAF